MTNFSQHTTQDTVVRLPNFVPLIMSCAVQMVVTWSFSFSWTSELHSTPLTMKFCWRDCMMRWTFPVALISGFVHTWLTEPSMSQWTSHFLTTDLWHVESSRLCVGPHPLLHLHHSTWQNYREAWCLPEAFCCNTNCFVLSIQTLHQPLLLFALLRSVVQM